ncbi:L-threonyl-[L-threonyl-carrier protein] 4-chlorinase-like [Mercenaria mercenaria]|uniref:L-threonyl-[L-threonyl-carrier protein] 4-chlorinase-like n=1 Tax=Mercenaria mercenaria TaxID=6596 RepID=UPI001E1D3C99|nr:L-threonyl-[L-threonyl-carrier protein] 4-chlorinase-like [Mercenaria mercenaria]
MESKLSNNFSRDGYLTGLDVLTDEEVAYFLKSFLAYEERLGGKVTGAYRFKSHLLLPWMYKLVTHPKILEIVKQIFGPDILCWSTDLFPKDPGTGKECAWHQDATYVGMDPPDALTVWVALTESNLQNGCVQFSKESHLKGQMEHTKTFADNSMLLYGQEIPVDVDKSTVVHAVLKPGQASVHHIMTVHASGPNKGDGRRIGIAVRYCGAYIKQQQGIGDSAMLVCGKDHGNFPLEPTPVVEFGPDEVEAHKKAVGAVGPEDRIKAQ